MNEASTTPDEPAADETPTVGVDVRGLLLQASGRRAHDAMFQAVCFAQAASDAVDVAASHLELFTEDPAWVRTEQSEAVAADVNAAADHLSKCLTLLLRGTRGFDDIAASMSTPIERLRVWSSDVASPDHSDDTAVSSSSDATASLPAESVTT